MVGGLDAGNLSRSHARIVFLLILGGAASCVPHAIFNYFFNCAHARGRLRDLQRRFRSARQDRAIKLRGYRAGSQRWQESLPLR